MKFCFLGAGVVEKFQVKVTPNNPKLTCFAMNVPLKHHKTRLMEPSIYSKFFRVMFSSLCRKGMWTTQTLKNGREISYSQLRALLPVLKTINNFDHLTPSTNPVLCCHVSFSPFKPFWHATQRKVKFPVSVNLGRVVMIGGTRRWWRWMQLGRQVFF